MKSVLITGSSGLIGTELCRKFLSAGYHVHGLDKKKGSLKDTAFTFHACDLAKPAAIKKVISKIKSLDVVINNAAATNLTFKKFSSITLKDWELGLAVNLTSVFVIAQETQKLLEKTHGSIINISSTRHLMSEPNTAIYSAGKGGVASLTHSLAVTLGPEIRVNSISPGWIDAEDKDHSLEDHAQHPAGRVGRPYDISETAYFLASDAAGFITGQDFVVDGGMTKKMIYV